MPAQKLAQKPYLHSPALWTVAAIGVVASSAPMMVLPATAFSKQPPLFPSKSSQVFLPPLLSSHQLIAQLNPRTEITRFYKELFGRAPDTDGLNYHLRRYNNGRSLGQIEQDFRNSPEGRRMALLLSSDAFGGTVRQLYLTELRREPEAAGLAYYVRALDRGRTLTRIQEEIRNTQEARYKRAISDLYRQALGTDPSDTQLQYYYNEVASNRKSFDSLREEFRRMAQPPASPSPQPVIPSPTPLPTVPSQVTPPRPGTPSALVGDAYYVVVPGGDVQDIATRMTRLGAPAASVQIRQQPRGPHVALGPFSDRRLANQWNAYFRGNGLDARVYYGR